MFENRIEFEGTVCSCCYNNSVSSDFPDGFVRFELREDTEKPESFNPRAFTVTGSKIPPIRTGNFVRGGCYEKRDSNNGKYFAVVHLNVSESREDGRGALYRLSDL